MRLVIQTAVIVGVLALSFFTAPTAGASTYVSNANGNRRAARTATVDFTISGHIYNASSTAISGVTVTLDGGQSGSTTTDTNGYYSFANLASDLDYTVTPSKTNYSFSNFSNTYFVLSMDQPDGDFTGTDFSGHVPSLGAAASFAVLAATTVTNTGLTVVSGNLGVSPGTAVTGFGPGVIQNGSIYSGAGSLAGPAQASALTAYNDLVAQGCLPVNNLSGKVLGVDTGAVTLGPGVYCFDTSAQLTTILTLNDGGDPNALFIFKIGTTLTTASYAQVNMSSGGRGNNVYWQIGTSATLGTFTAFRGNIIAKTSITVTTSVSTVGRLIALEAAVTMDTNNVNAVPAVALPSITLTASVSPTGIVQPRTDLVYTIDFSNNGAGSASAFVITDPIPTNTDFKLGSVTTSLGTTGLTSTLSYSNNGGLTWTYTPLSAAGGAPIGYDRNVTGVRWSFASILSQTLPNNAGSVTFTARIR
jgi:uncharacterized repeat protein (TIGR01451 family)